MKKFVKVGYNGEGEAAVCPKDEYTIIFDNKIRICVNSSTKVLNYFT